MSSFRRAVPRVAAWHTPPGALIPEPRVIVDSASEFPAAVVREVREYLRAIRNEPRFRKPTPMLISNVGITPSVDAVMKRIAGRLPGDIEAEVRRLLKARLPVPIEERLKSLKDSTVLSVMKTAACCSVIYGQPDRRIKDNWVPCTIQLLLKDKKHSPILATYDYMAARLNADPKYVIVGERLRTEQKAMVA